MNLQFLSFETWKKKVDEQYRLCEQNKEKVLKEIKTILRIIDSISQENIQYKN